MKICNKCEVKLNYQSTKAGYDVCGKCRHVHELKYKGKIEQKFCETCNKQLDVETILSKKRYVTCHDCRKIEKESRNVKCESCNSKLHHRIWQTGGKICRLCESKSPRKIFYCVTENCKNCVSREGINCQSCVARKNFQKAAQDRKNIPILETFLENHGISEGYFRYRKFIEIQILSKIKNKYSKGWKNVQTPEIRKKRGIAISKSLRRRLFDNDHRLKLRLIALSRIGQVIPNHNRNSIKIIEQYGKDNGYNFQHAENLGEYHIKELGYFVDGYDKEKNVVIEYYETGHSKNIERDERRKQEIIALLGCDFIEIYEDDWNFK